MAAKQLQCVVVTPERTILDEPAEFVAVPMYDGELGVAPGRAPLIGRLGFGELRTKTGNREKRYYVDGGFVQIRDNAVTVLTARASKAEDINLAAVEAQAEAARNLAAKNPDAAQQASARAQAQRRVAARAG